MRIIKYPKVKGKLLRLLKSLREQEQSMDDDCDAKEWFSLMNKIRKVEKIISEGEYDEFKRNY